MMLSPHLSASLAKRSGGSSQAWVSRTASICGRLSIPTDGREKRLSILTGTGEDYSENIGSMRILTPLICTSTEE